MADDRYVVVGLARPLAVEHAIEAWRFTRGLFDPTVLGALEQAGLRVVPRICGELESVISAFREGILKGVNEYSNKKFVSKDVRDGMFDLVLTNPPFAGKITGKTQLAAYDLYELAATGALAAEEEEEEPRDRGPGVSEVLERERRPGDTEPACERGD